MYYTFMSKIIAFTTIVYIVVNISHIILYAYIIWSLYIVLVNPISYDNNPTWLKKIRGETKAINQ